MNRKHRRALDRHRRSESKLDPNAKAVKAAIEKIQQAQERQGFLQNAFQAADNALRLSVQIPKVEKPEGWTEEDGDPNAVREDLIAQAEERVEETKLYLVEAFLDTHDAYRALLEPSLVEVVPALLVPGRTN